MFSSKVKEKLKYYVYLYVDPRTDQPFYIGKGRGDRAFAHLKDNGESQKTEIIKTLAKLGLKPRIELLKYGLTEGESLLVEATAIDLLDVKQLANKVRGHGARYAGRTSVEQVSSLLDAREVNIIDPVILININQEYRYAITEQELYDATRSAWVVAQQRREKAQYAISIYRGVAQEVYAISVWVPGGSTMRYNGTELHAASDSNRWEFVGKIAEHAVRKRYVGKSVAGYFTQGAQNPIKYVNC